MTFECNDWPIRFKYSRDLSNKYISWVYFYQSWSIFTCRLGNFGILFVILVIKTVEFKLNKTMLFSKLPLFLKPTWVHCCSNWQIIHGIRQFGTQYWKWMCNRLSLSLDVCLFLWMHSHTCVASGFHSNHIVCSLQISTPTSPLQITFSIIFL